MWLHFSKALCIFTSLVPASAIHLTHGFRDAVTAGERVSLTCETYSAYPPALIKWRRNTEIINENKDYTITSSQVKGQFNADYTISTLSFIVLEEHKKEDFHCFVADHNNIAAAAPMESKIDSTLNKSTQILIEFQIKKYYCILHLLFSILLNVYSLCVIGFRCKFCRWFLCCNGCCPYVSMHFQSN